MAVPFIMTLNTRAVAKAAAIRNTPHRCNLLGDQFSGSPWWQVFAQTSNLATIQQSYNYIHLNPANRRSG